MARGSSVTAVWRPKENSSSTTWAACANALVDGAVVELAAEAGVICGARIDQRATNLARTVDIDDDGEVLVIDLDQLQRIFRKRPALGDDGHHSLPGPDHAVERQWQLRGRRHALEVVERAGPGRADLCEVLAGGNEMHPFERARLLGIDGDDLRVRMRTAQERGMEHARQLEIADIASAPGEQPLGVRPRHGPADIGVRDGRARSAARSCRDLRLRCVLSPRRRSHRRSLHSRCSGSNCPTARRGFRRGWAAPPARAVHGH